jgi:hypothetical protein
MTFARDLASFADSATQNLSFRNLIINGAMQVAQRNTSVASITSGFDYRTADRWNFYVSSLGTWTNSVENDAPTGSGFRKSFKNLCTTADASPSASDECFVSQKIEGQNLQQVLKGTSSAKELTLSFWVKSNVTGTYIAELYDNDNTRSVSKSYTISASATWEKKTITFPADTTGAFDNDNALSLYVNFWQGAGSNLTSGTLATSWGSVTTANRAVGQTNLAAATNNYWQVTGVQLEVGPAPTPFEFLPVQTEFALCQRYYQRSSSSDIYAYHAQGWATSTSTGIFGISTKVRLRDDAASIEYANLALTADDGSIIVISSIVLATNQSKDFVQIVFYATGLTQFRPYMILNNNSATGYIGFSAEL